MIKAVAILMVGILVVSAGGNELATQPQVDAGRPKKFQPTRATLDLGDNVKLALVRIPPGNFLMGSPKDEKGRKHEEGLLPGKWVDGSPQFVVTISKPFYIGVCEVTVAQYAQFEKDTLRSHPKPGFKQADNHPVVNVSWDDARVFCAWLSKKTGKTVSLPTEAQWEYACRAGSNTRFCFGDNDNELGDYAWYRANSMDEDKGTKMTHPVGQKYPTWGLYDMHGNAWEWCADFFGEYAGASTDPTGPKAGSLRVIRGGSWDNDPGSCRSAYRNAIHPALGYHNVGFRVVVGADELQIQK